MGGRLIRWLTYKSTTRGEDGGFKQQITYLPFTGQQTSCQMELYLSPLTTLITD